MIYPDFEIEIMRYGYDGTMIKSVLEKIADRHAMDVNELEDPNNIESVVQAYFLHRLIYRKKHNRFKTKNLLMIAYLLCHTVNEAAGEESLWALIAPNVAESVDRSVISMNMILLAKLAC